MKKSVFAHFIYRTTYSIWAEACSAQTVCDSPTPPTSLPYMARILIALWHGNYCNFFPVATDRSRTRLFAAILVSESNYLRRKAHLRLIACDEPFSLQPRPEAERRVGGVRLGMGAWYATDPRLTHTICSGISGSGKLKFCIRKRGEMESFFGIDWRVFPDMKSGKRGLITLIHES